MADELKEDCFAIVNKNTQSVMMIGSEAVCIQKCNSCNAVYGDDRFHVVPHKANDYVNQLIARQNASPAFSTKKTIRIELPQRSKLPPVIVPTVTTKSKVAEYLNKLKK